MPLVDQVRLETDAAYREDMRHRFITDWFFACELLGRPMHPVLHKPVADFYPKLNPNLSIPEQDAIKNYLLLDPRWSWKTTGSRIQKIQMLAAFPEQITILNQAATQPLAIAISETVSRVFYFDRFNKPTPLQQMFPEIATNKEPFTRADTWSTPPRQKYFAEGSGLADMDASVSFTSPQSVQSGWHPWVINADDMVESKNSGTRANPDVRQGIIDLYDTNKNTLNPGGYIFLTGTRYHPFDLYGVRLQDMDRSKWKVLVRSSMERKDGSRLLPGEFPAERDVMLHFADIPGLGYESLREKFYDNYEVFMCQQQNDPQGGHTAVFPDALYDSCEIDEDRVPAFGGELFTCWRLPYGSKPATNRFAEGICARVENGRVYVVDCWRFGGTPSHQAEMIVQSHRKAEADAMLVLGTPGSDSAWTLLRNEGMKKNLSLRINWTNWEENDNLRASSVKQMEPALKVGRLLFQRGMTRGAECRKQFVHYGLIEETGLIECVSRMAGSIDRSIARANMDEEELEWQRRAQDKAMLADFCAQHEMLGGRAVVDAAVQQRTLAHMQAMSEATSWGMPPMPGGLDG